MKKILATTLCCAALSSFAFAEDSGAFVGVSYQFGQTKFAQHIHPHLEAPYDKKSIPDYDQDKKAYTNGAGLKIGYKQFFGQSKWFGLRYYAFLDYGYSDFGNLLPNFDDVNNQGDVLSYKTYYTHSLSYGVGIDTLWNIINKENASFGIFAGVGVGADTWIASGKDVQKKMFPNGKAAYANFQTTIDAGIRANLAKHHGLEVGVKVPLLTDQIFKDLNDYVQDSEIGVNQFAPLDLDTTSKMTHIYSVYVSYLYTF